VAGDDDILGRARVAGDRGVHGLQLAGHRLGLDHRAERELFPAGKARDQLVPLAGRDGPTEALCVDRDARRGNHIDAAIGIQGAVADRANRAPLRGHREDLGDAAAADRDLAFQILPGVVLWARAEPDVDEFAGDVAVLAVGRHRDRGRDHFFCSFAVTATARPRRAQLRFAVGNDSISTLEKPYSFAKPAITSLSRKWPWYSEIGRIRG
jgi:hypothetical protein